MKKTLQIDEVTKIVGFLGLFLLFCANLKSALYYRSFGIDIFNYVEFSETLTLFISDVFIMAPFILVCMSTSLIGGEDNRTHIYDARIQKIIYGAPFVTRLFIYFKKRIFAKRLIFSANTFPPGIIAFLIGPVGYAFMYAIDNYLPVYLVLLAITFPFVWLSYIIFCEFERIYLRNTEKAPSSLYITLIPACVMLLILSISTAFIQAEQIRKHIGGHGVMVMINKKLFSTNANTALLGKTKNYFIFYKTDSLKVLIVAANGLELIENAKNDKKSVGLPRK